MLAFQDKYEIIRRLGQGGYSEVFECRNLQTERLVAVKILQRTKNSVELKRFQNEAKLLSSLSHPNIVRVFEFGVVAGDKLFIAMELLRGIIKDCVNARYYLHENSNRSSSKFSVHYLVCTLKLFCTVI